MRLILAVILSMTAPLLAGCAGGGTGATETPLLDSASLPPNYRQIIVSKVKETFFDPYSIRDASISQPIAGRAALGPVATICVRSNAKNRMGGYTGLKATSYTFRAGALTVVDDQYAALTCDKATYEPFPEIDAGSPPRADNKSTSGQRNIR